MHNNEINISEKLAYKLIRAQFPEWATLSLEPMRPEGTDNLMYRLGEDKIIRLPRIPSAVPSLEKEKLWLPKLTPHLPIPIPHILAEGDASDEYPYPWLIIKWEKGKNPSADNPLEQNNAALTLASFIKAMQKIDTQGGPICRRGQPLKNRDAETRKAIPLMSELYDTKLLLDLWNESLSAPEWHGKPVWIHGDLHAGNILCEGEQITAIVDFGLMGVGDPAADLMPAWTLFDPAAREIFKEIVAPDEATWLRARGWALSMGIVAYPYYKETNPKFAEIALGMIDQVIRSS